MKRLIIALTLIAFATSTTALVGNNASGDGPRIMAAAEDNNSISGPAAVKLDGTMWSAEVAMINRSANYTDNQVRDGSFSTANNTSIVEFGGLVQAGTPCHMIDSEVSESGNNSYRMDMRTVRNETDNQTMCIQQAVMINYTASFKAEEPFQLEVRHNNQTIRNLTHPEFENGTAPPEEPERRGLFEGFFDWMSNLF